MKESADVGRAQDTVESVTQRLQELDADLKAETESIQQTSEAQTETLETISLKPTKSNIDIRLVTLAWTPYWRDAQGQIVPGWE
jgi:hypothetical protein